MSIARRAAVIVLASIAVCGAHGPQGSHARADATTGPAVRAVAPATASIAKRQWDAVAGQEGPACRAALAASGAKFSSVPDMARPDASGCGVPHGVVLFRGATGIVYAPPLHVDCALARDLLAVERVVQEAAARHLGGPITRIRTLGGFACRNKRGWLGTSLSEHAFGMAADFAAFEPKRGAAAVVARDYEVGVASPLTPRGRFLREVIGRIRAETPLVHSIGPDFNAAHRDHFHVDGGIPWWELVSLEPPSSGTR